MTSTAQKVDLSKAQEIALIEKLCNSDSYFSQYFKRDCQQMTSNIKNDFAIEAGCQFMTENEQLNYQLDEAKKEIERLKKEKAELGDIIQENKNFASLLSDQVNSDEARLQKIAYKLIIRFHNERTVDPSDLFSNEEIIKVKLLNGWSLNPEESNFVINKAGL